MTALSWALFAEKYSLPKLAATCERFVMLHFAELSSSPELAQVHCHTVCGHNFQHKQNLLHRREARGMRPVLNCNCCSYFSTRLLQHAVFI